MKNIAVISTGGTFNKIYSSSRAGNLEVDIEAKALREISTKWRCELKITTIIGKDSLDMDCNDRQLLLCSISAASEDDIIVIHGTDTIDKSAHVVSDAGLKKRIVFVGAMIPYAIDPIEATANFASAYGFLQGIRETGVYVAMNGIMGHYNKVIKNRERKRFELL